MFTNKHKDRQTLGVKTEPPPTFAGGGKEAVTSGISEIFKIRVIDKISTEEFFSRMDSDRTRDHGLKVKKRGRWGSFTQREGNACNSLTRKVLAAETVDRMKFKVDRYKEVSIIEGYIY